MSKDQEEFLKELLNDFRIEAAEHLQELVNGLLELEKELNSKKGQEIIERVFRETHSLKGAARAVNLMQIERLCSDLESVFHGIKKGDLVVASNMFDVFYQITDYLDVMVKEIDSPYKSISENDIIQINRKLQSVCSTDPMTKLSPSVRSSGNHDNESKDEPFEESVTTPMVTFDHDPYDGSLGSGGSMHQSSGEKETIRVSIEKLLEMLRMSEEVISVKSILKYHTQQLHVIYGKFNQWRSKLDDQVLASDLTDGCRSWKDIFEEDLFVKHESDLNQFGMGLEQIERSLDRSLDDLTVSIKMSLLQPFSKVFMVVPRITRDLSREYGKEINLEIGGSDIEIDRRILEEMKDPIIHLIRNCIDHGIEKKEERLLSNKPPEGKISIAVSNIHGQKLRLVISDDGAGLDLDKLVRSAVKLGVVKDDEVSMMSDHEKAMLVFASGITTSSMISDVSGRGLGMAIVAEKIARVGGSVDIETKPGIGTSYVIALPQTLSVFKGILVRASDQLFLLPTLAVAKAILIRRADMKTVESKNTISFEHETLGLVHLAETLGVRNMRTAKKNDAIQALIIHYSQKRIAFIIDEVLGEYEGVVKPLGKQLKHVYNISGACLLGDGRIVPVLNIHELMASALQGNHSADSGHPNEASQKEKSQKHVLIAEDSITVRNMLRGFLETAGFKVKTAVDGQIAYELLQNDAFDIVVSDVEMPRMNGFELTTKIRQNKRLGQIPVILVTALESANDRQRGMEVGANAYIVKSSFEKSNLIDTMNRLV